MKIALLGINARYTHSNLAIKYLSEEVKTLVSCDTLDFTINDNKEKILHYLISGDYSHIGFSTYIWNVEIVKEIIRDLKNINKNLVLFVGGPEVSFDSEEFILETGVDYLMVGDGEEIFPELVKNFIKPNSKEIPSVLTLSDGIVQGSSTYAISQKIPAIYQDNKYIEANKYVYYEASRGCPYNCAFCLSSAKGRTRFKDLDLVKSEIDTFLQEKVDIVKFIDRSFNFNPRAKDIIKYIKENDNNITTFHLEVHPSLLDEDFVELIKSSRKDLFQFEIGLQTTNDKTAKEIQRAGSYEDIKKICQELITSDAHIHMDLIAGLPYEDVESFKKSFNDLYDLGPEKIQLGFLKLLKGSRLRRDEKKYGYKYYEKAPYEVISNKWISYEDIIYLKGIEDMVERYYNEGYFKYTLNYLMENYYQKAWDFFEAMAKYWKSRDLLYTNVSRIDLYNIFHDFIDDAWDRKIINELLIYDYYNSGNNRSSKFKLADYHPTYNNSYVIDLIQEKSDKIKELGLDPDNILKKSTVEIFNLDEDLLYTNEIHYHIFVKINNRDLRSFVLGR